MSYYFWLGADAEQPIADETPREYETHGDTTILIEDDGFITVHATGWALTT